MILNKFPAFAFNGMTDQERARVRMWVNLTVANTEENSSDENDVDDETMSSEQMSAHTCYM
jgi:hypothetical protein